MELGQPLKDVVDLCKEILRQGDPSEAKRLWNTINTANDKTSQDLLGVSPSQNKNLIDRMNTAEEPRMRAHVLVRQVPETSIWNMGPDYWL